MANANQNEVMRSPGTTVLDGLDASERNLLGQYYRLNFSLSLQTFPPSAGQLSRKVFLDLQAEQILTKARKLNGQL